MKKNKEVLINLRLKSDVREGFRIAAELRGATMSGLLHQFIVRTIREEKDRDPEAFVRLKNKDLTEGEHASEQYSDPDPLPVQTALYKKFLSEQEAKGAEAPSKKPDDIDTFPTDKLDSGR